MITAEQIANDLSPHLEANNAAIGETNRRLAKVGDGQGDPQPANLLTPRDVFYRSSLDQNDRGVAILHPKCPIPIQQIDGYYDQEVWIANAPGSSQVYIMDLADGAGFGTDGITPEEALINAAAFPDQSRLVIMRIRPSDSSGMAVFVDVGPYQIAYEVGDGTYGFLASADVDLSDPTNDVTFNPTAAELDVDEHRLVGIAFDGSTGQFFAIPGAARSTTETLPSAESRSEFTEDGYLAIDFTGYYPAGYVYTYYGQATPEEDDCLRQFDPRLFMQKMGASGDVAGPASSTDNTVVRFNGTTGKVLQNSGVMIDDSNNVTIPGSTTMQGSQAVAVRVVTAVGAVTVGATDYIVVVNKSVGAATTVNLPAGAAGRSLVIKDGKGDAGANNITVTPAAGTIDGASTYVIAANYGAVRLVYNGTEWNVI